MSQVISEKTNIWLPIGTLITVVIAVAWAFYRAWQFTSKVDYLVAWFVELKADVKVIKETQMTPEKVKDIIAQSNEKKN